jgi:cellulose biosynthesis protein BcsQ
MSTKQPPTRVIAFACSKGGVGKSTLAITLAVRASAESKRVAVVDIDPQESALSWGDRRKQEHSAVDAECLSMRITPVKAKACSCSNSPMLHWSRFSASIGASEFG